MHLKSVFFYINIYELIGIRHFISASYVTYVGIVELL